MPKEKPPINITGDSLIYRYGNLPDFVNSFENDLDFYREGFIYKRDHELKEAEQKPNKTVRYTLNTDKGKPPTITIIFQIKYLNELPMANFLRQVKYNDESIKTEKFVWFKNPNEQKEIYQRAADVKLVPNMSTLPAAYRSLLKDIFEEYLILNKKKYTYTYLPNLPQDIGLTTTGKRLRLSQRAAIVSMNKLKVKRGAQNKKQKQLQTWRNEYRDTKFPIKANLKS